jgi:hypothetical protein
MAHRHRDRILEHSDKDNAYARQEQDQWERCAAVHRRLQHLEFTMKIAKGAPDQDQGCRTGPLPTLAPIAMIPTFCHVVRPIRLAQSAGGKEGKRLADWSDSEYGKEPRRSRNLSDPERNNAEVLTRIGERL